MEKKITIDFFCKIVPLLKPITIEINLYLCEYKNAYYWCNFKGFKPLKGQYLIFQKLDLGWGGGGGVTSVNQSKQKLYVMYFMRWVFTAECFYEPLVSMVHKKNGKHWVIEDMLLW